MSIPSYFRAAIVYAVACIDGDMFYGGVRPIAGEGQRAFGFGPKLPHAKFPEDPTQGFEFSDNHATDIHLSCQGGNVWEIYYLSGGDKARFKFHECAFKGAYVNSSLEFESSIQNLQVHFHDISFGQSEDYQILFVLPSVEREDDPY
jgi:hypothetical protein